MECTLLHTTPQLRAETHCHTNHSDGASSVADMVAAARARGCSVVAITDHLTLPEAMDPSCECSVPVEELLPLAEEICDVSEELSTDDDIEVVFGFECDWYEGCETNIERWSRGATFRLGSVHWVAGGWIDDPNDLSVWHELGPDEVWRRYVDAWCAACESPVAFDTMAHPDLPARFSHEGLAPTIALDGLWGRMATCAHDTGRHVELSSAGLRKGAGDYYPSKGLLGRFCQAGVPITIGSDAHRPEDVAWGLDEAARHAAAMGYRSFDVPRADGSWTSVAL